MIPVKAKVICDADPSGLDWLWWCRGESCDFGGEHRTNSEAIHSATEHVREKHRGHVCDTGDFDRTVCGCGVMHSYCSTCGARQDECSP